MAKHRPFRFVGIGPLSWTFICIVALVLAAIGRHLSGAPRWPTQSERHAAQIEEKLDQLGPDHPWAGRYSTGSGLTGTELSVAPGAGYKLTQWGDAGPWSATETGYFRIEDGALVAQGSTKYRLRAPLIPVRWGRRHYLISEDALSRFANDVNAGYEPGYGGGVLGWSYLLREGDEDVTVRGFPELPSPARELLRSLPLDAEISSVGNKFVDAMELHRHHEAPVILNRGRNRGAVPGLILHRRGSSGGTAEIVRVYEEYSLARISWDDLDSQPKRGWKFSTRVDSYRHYDPFDEPLEIDFHPLTDHPFPRYDGFIRFEADEKYLSAARRAGFTVRPAARIVVRAIEKELVSSRLVDRSVHDLARGLGANVAGPWTEAEHGRAPLVNSRTAQFYRVEWKGQALDGSDFPFDLGKEPADWSKAGRKAELNRDPYFRAQERIRNDAAEELLHLPSGAYKRVSEMDILDLTSEQRSAFRKFLGLKKTRGPLTRELNWSGGWWKKLDEAAADRLAALKASDPKGDRRCRDLLVAARR